MQVLPPSRVWGTEPGVFLTWNMDGEVWGAGQGWASHMAQPTLKPYHAAP